MSMLLYILLSNHRSLWWQVKLVKCKVQNIAVDISVNQIGGPNKLHFLEKVIVMILEYRGKHRHGRSQLVIKKTRLLGDLG